MRTVGLLLVSALMVVPVATTQQIVGAFRPTLYISMVLGAATSVGGVVVSSYIDVAPGATIVLLALAFFAAAWPVGALVRRRKRLREPFPSTSEDVHDHEHADHEHGHDGHVHGPDCGHLAVKHGDHVDYVHEGHRHASHEDHYDEH
jgi:zinc transport system permease protein